MPAVFNKAIIVFLALLQFFAPLVHAHSGAHHKNFGIHIPGLESYASHNHHAAGWKNVNSAWQSEGCLVMIDAGIKSPQPFSGQAHQTSLAAFYSPCHPVISSDGPNFSPDPRFDPAHLYYPPLSPRAPPA